MSTVYTIAKKKIKALSIKYGNIIMCERFKTEPFQEQRGGATASTQCLLYLRGNKSRRDCSELNYLCLHRSKIWCRLKTMKKDKAAKERSSSGSSWIYVNALCINHCCQNRAIDNADAIKQLFFIFNINWLNILLYAVNQLQSFKNIN